MLRLVVTVVAFGASVAAAAAPPAQGRDWLNHNGAADQASYSPLQQISAANVGQLGLAWSLDLPGEQSLEATPLAVNGVLFFTGSRSTAYAVEAVTGRLLWTYDPRVHEHMPQHMHDVFPVNRGAAYLDGRVFVGTLDGRLIALDAASGKLLWSVETVTAESKHTITGAPLAFNNEVLIGNGGADLNERGYVTAYDATTGRQLWRFHTVPGNPAEERNDPALRRAAATWHGQWWKVGGGGGTAWDNMTYDPELDRVYIGTGNGGPYDRAVRSPGGGDNLYLASIVAVDARSGRYLWHYQVNPGEAWDYKATANMVCATLELDGKPRKVLMQSPTNGFFYVLDRNTGKLLSAAKTGKVTWAERIDLHTGRPVEADNIRYSKGPVDMWPSAYGTHNWQAMSYSPRTRLVYIPFMQLGARYAASSSAQAEFGATAHMGGVDITPLIADAEDGKGALLAWDPVAQRARWKVPLESFWNGGVLSTAGNLVFQGDGDGKFSAYNAADGARVWQFDAGLGIVAAPISFEAAGQQYVAILVGYGGATTLWSSIFNRGWKFGAQPRRLLAFALGKHAQLPPTAPRDLALHALDDPALTLPPEQVDSGRRLYMSNCAACHGQNLLSAGAPAPDLRESTAALSLQTVRTIVQGGVLAPQGMPQFPDLGDEAVRDLYMYIRDGARRATQAR